MYIRIALVTLAVLALTSCARQSTQQPERLVIEEHAVYPANVLGVTVDENLRVIDLDTHGAASLAGVQRGDILIDLTLVELSQDTIVVNDNITVESPLPTPTATIEAAPLPPGAFIDNDTVASPTLPLEANIDSVASEDIGTAPAINEAIPFTNKERVKDLINLDATVKLKVNREGNILEITLRTTPPAPRPNSPTPTAVMPPYDYF